MYTAQNNVISLTTDIHAQEVALTNAHSARTTLATLASAGSTIHTYLVSDADIVSFLSVLEGIGHTVGATVSTIAVTPQTNVQHPMLTVSVKVVGSFDTVIRAIGAIENMPYYVTINTLTLGNSVSVLKPDSNKDWVASIILSVGSTAQTISSTQP